MVLMCIARRLGANPRHTEIGDVQLKNIVL